MSSTLQLPEITETSTDVLILGAGLAGHSAALAAAEERGCRVTMAFLGRGASPFVIGCNVALGHADARDNADVYFDDMMRGGYQINDRRLVRLLADNASDVIEKLADLGIPFAGEDGHYHQRHLSGNTYPRSVYVAEGTGRIILEGIQRRIKALNVEQLAGWRAVGLMQDDDVVVGCLLFRRHSNQLLAVRASAVVLAMGGIGQIYGDSTYPVDVSANSYALAYDAGAHLIDMEFVQFEPVVTVYPEACRGMEMPTAMLGDGAHLLNACGDRFMFRYNPDYGEKRIEKARMSLCIQQEIDEGRGLPDSTVLFDTTVVPHDKLESYVLHCRRLRSAGLEPTEAGPHVRPAAHSQMGGVAIDERCWSGVPGLYAGGEAAGGVHGASRLAGNGCSDTLVFGTLAGRAATLGRVNLQGRDWKRIVADVVAPLRLTLKPDAKVTTTHAKAAIRTILGAAAGLYRDGEQLAAGREKLATLEHEISKGIAGASLQDAVNALEVRNMTLTARMILDAAFMRTESRGAHQRRDYPQRDDEHWLKHLAISRDATQRMIVESVPLQ